MLKPTDLAHALTHDRTFTQAVALLNLKWETNPNAIVNNLVTAVDVQFARRLQEQEIISGKVDLTEYRDCAQLIAHHGGWLSPGARNALLAPFTD